MINWNSKCEKRLLTTGVAYYRQLQEHNGRICEGQQQREVAVREQVILISVSLESFVS
jgi:hypothetical protein